METSLIIFTDIITPSVVFPIDTVTQTVLLTTDIGTINTSFTVSPSTVLSTTTFKSVNPTTATTTLVPTPTVTIPILVVMRFSTSANVKRDASNYTSIESEIANATGISAERINIVTLIMEVNGIVINAEILDLSSNEFTALNDLFSSRNVSITYQGMAYFSSSIVRQQPGKLCRKQCIVLFAVITY